MRFGDGGVFPVLDMQIVPAVGFTLSGSLVLVLPQRAAQAQRDNPLLDINLQDAMSLFHGPVVYPKLGRYNHRSNPDLRDVGQLPHVSNAVVQYFGERTYRFAVSGAATIQVIHGAPHPKTPNLPQGWDVYTTVKQSQEEARVVDFSGSCDRIQLSAFSIADGMTLFFKRDGKTFRAKGSAQEIARATDLPLAKLLLVEDRLLGA